MSKASKLDGCQLALTGCPWASCLTSWRFQCPHSEKGVSYILAITVIAISIYCERVKGFTNITWLNPLNTSVRVVVVQLLSCVQLCDLDLRQGLGSWSWISWVILGFMTTNLGASGPSLSQGENESRSVLSNSLGCHGLYSPWYSPGLSLESG